MSNGTVLITGVHGFIGRHLANALDDEGAYVTGIDRNEKPRCGPKPRYSEFRCQDLRDLSLDYPHDFSEFDYVFHLAASTGLTSSDHWLKDSYPAYRENVETTYALLKNMRKDATIVFLSSAAVYGMGRQLSDDSPIFPDSAYGFTKAVAERVIEASGRDFVIFRPGTVVGPWGRSWLNRMVWEIVNKQEIVLFNNGNNRRSIIDVVDVVRAMMEMSFSSWHEITNLSYGDEISGLQLYKIVAEEAKKRGYEPQCKTTPYTPKGLADVVTLRCKYPSRTVPLIQSIKILFDHYEKEQDEPVQQFEVKI